MKYGNEGKDSEIRREEISENRRKMKETKKKEWWKRKVEAKERVEGTMEKREGRKESNWNVWKGRNEGRK